MAFDCPSPRDLNGGCTNALSLKATNKKSIRKSISIKYKNKYKNEIIFVPSLIFMRWFLRRRCFCKETLNFEHSKPRKPPLRADFDLS